MEELFCFTRQERFMAFIPLTLIGIIQPLALVVIICWYALLMWSTRKQLHWIAICGIWLSLAGMLHLCKGLLW